MTRILPKGPAKPPMPANVTFRGTQEPRRRAFVIVEPDHAERMAREDRVRIKGVAFGFVLGILAWLGVWVFADFCVWLAGVTR